MRAHPSCTLLITGLLAAGAAHGTTLFGLVDTGELYASANGGANWAIRSTLPVRDAVALAAGASSEELFLASTSGSFYRSDDAGASWSVIGAVPAPDVTALASSPARLLLFTSSGTVFASTDGGTSFAAVGAITASDLVSATRMDGSHFALARSGTVLRSDDDGATWGAIGALATSEAVELVALQGTLYALTASGDIGRSQDSGASWTFVGTLSQVGMTALLASNGELVASTAAGEIAASFSGTGWAWRGAVGQLTVRALANDTPTTTGVEDARGAGVEFARPSPNPARESVTLSVNLPAASRITVGVYDVSGRLVARPLDDEILPAGLTVRRWRPGALEDGVYWARLSFPDGHRVRSFVWLDGR